MVTLTKEQLAALVKLEKKLGLEYFTIEAVEGGLTVNCHRGESTATIQMNPYGRPL